MTSLSPTIPPRADAPKALAFDVQEWFHDPALAGQLSHRHWRRLPSRVALGVDHALSCCARHGASATFFVLGAVAERNPDLVRRIVAAGHEVASAGWQPRDLSMLSLGERDAELRDWARARAVLEAISGVAVRGFRAAWPVVRGGSWWHESLVAAGYRYDASEAPAANPAGTPLAVPVLRQLGQSGAVAICVSTWQLDIDQPRLVGLPSRALKAHYAPLEVATGQLVRTLAAGPRCSLAVALGLGPAPFAVRAPLRAPVPVVTKEQRVRSEMPRLAIVVPLKDEAAGLPSLVVELDELTVRLASVAALEFVFVDDGSGDRTWQLLQELLGTRSGVQLVQHPHNQGVAAAIRTGIRTTTAPLVASIDGDLSYDPVEIEHMLPLLAGADVVTASPYHRSGGVKNVPAWRLSLSRTLSWLYQRLLHSEVRTWTSCFRLYRRASVVDLPLDNQGFLGTAELLVRVLRRGGVVREHPCVLEARLFGLSKMKVLRTICGHLQLLWRVARGRIS